MKKLTAVALAAASLALATACSYGGVSTVGNNVVITRNDNFLFGLLRVVYVCKVSDAGVNNCHAAEAP